ncbi:MAG: DUF2232 domain-containing protein [Eubacteriales bacterium]
MEKSNQPTSNETRKGYWILLLAVVAGVLAAYVPFLLVIAPALWAYAGVRTKPYWILVPVAAFAYGAFTFETATVAIALTAGALIVALLLSTLLTHGFSNSDTVLILCGVFLLMLYGAICLPELLSGNEAYAAIQSQIGDIRALYRASESQLSQINPDGVKLILETLDTMYEGVPIAFVSVLIIFSSVLGLGNLLFFRAFCKKRSRSNFRRAPVSRLDTAAQHDAWTVRNADRLHHCGVYRPGVCRELFHDGKHSARYPAVRAGHLRAGFLYRAPAKESHRRADADIYRTCCSISVCAVPAGAGRLL